MITARNDDDFFSVYFVDETVCAIDASGPASSKIKLQWFWFAYPFKWTQVYGFTESIDTFGFRWIIPLPILVIPVSLFGESHLHV